MTYDEAKDEVLQLHPAQLNAQRIVQLAVRETAAAGFVVWDAASASSDWTSHKQTFADAVFTALAFCGTTGRFEWLVVGQSAMAVLRSHQRFAQVESISCFPTPYFYIGKLGIISVYLSPGLAGDDWFAGLLQGKVDDAHLCCRGTIHHLPFSLAPALERPPRVEAGAPMWRALQGYVAEAAPEDEEADGINTLLDEADDNPVAELVIRPDHYIDPETFEERPVRRQS